MIIDKDFYNYFMKPQPLDGVGDIYPIKIAEYSIFKEYASKYLLAGRKWLANICKYPKDEYILDFFVKNALMMEVIEVSGNEFEEGSNITEVLKSDELLKYKISEMEEMFSMTLKKAVKFELLSVIDDAVIDYRFQIGEGDKYITKFNFENYREVVMEQNLLFEPLTSPSERGNEAIQNAIKVLSKNGVTQDLISVCSTVSTYKGVSDEELQEYTYYRLMCDFETINRINNNIIYAMFMAQGSKDAEITYLGEVINVSKNPYEGLLKRNGDNQLTKRLQGR